MTFDEILAQVLALLQHQGRVSYRALKVRFTLDDDTLEALKDEIIYAHRRAVDEDGRVLVWTGGTGTTPPAAAAPAEISARPPLAYTPAYLAEKILTSRSALEGERKQVTVLFAALKGSMELLAELTRRKPGDRSLPCYGDDLLAAPGRGSAGTGRSTMTMTRGENRRRNAVC
jgi:hypothetical protein